MIATTATMMSSAKTAFVPVEECLAEPWSGVDVVVEAVEDVDVDVGLSPYGQ
jgi:hypothetical protein